MGNMHIVTGYRGENHVTAADVGSFNAAVFGGGEFVLDRGSKFEASILSNNKIGIADGDLLMQGRHVRLTGAVELTIENGQTSWLRNDLIVARYTMDNATGVEDVNLVVIKGTAVQGSDPVDPEYTSADIINDTVYLNDMPLYRVPLNGLNVQALVPLFTLAPSMGEHAQDKAVHVTEAEKKEWHGKQEPIVVGTTAPDSATGLAVGTIYIYLGESTFTASELQTLNNRVSALENDLAATNILLGVTE